MVWKALVASLLGAASSSVLSNFDFGWKYVGCGMRWAGWVVGLPIKPNGASISNEVKSCLYSSQILGDSTYNPPQCDASGFKYNLTGSLIC